MAHRQQREFFKSVRREYPWHFRRAKVLEVGSLNVNGSCRDLFYDCDYTGIDIGPGPDVDIICPGQDFDQDMGEWDTVISGEMFEHNEEWLATWLRMIELCRPGGLIVFSCATPPRKEHGTKRTTPKSSPFTPDYYENRVAEDFPVDAFAEYGFDSGGGHHDLYFWGIKHGKQKTDQEGGG